MHKKALSFAFALILFSSTALALSSDVAIVLGDAFQPSQNIINILNDLNLTYDSVTNSQLSQTNFSQYTLIIVQGELSTLNSKLIPLKDSNVIVLNKKVAEETWNVITTSQTSKRELKAYNKQHYILQGITIPIDDLIPVYEGFLSADIHDLIVSQAGFNKVLLNPSNSRTVLGESTSANGKQVFFGIVEANKWNLNSKTMFKNSILWIISDLDQDEDGSPNSLDCNDHDSNTYPGASEIPYDGIDQDCSGSDLADIDLDGFNSNEVGGLDCDDFNVLINPNNPDKTLNCINDAPELLTINNISVNEGDFVAIASFASDPESDALTFSINSNKFTQQFGLFVWHTTYLDSGLYEFIVKVSDGEFEDSQLVSVQVNNVNEPPLSSIISDLTWEEDSESSIDLSLYFSDNDLDELTYGIESSSNENIGIKISNNIFTFSPDKDFFGQGNVIFWAFDGAQKTISNLVTLTVTPVNDLLEFHGPIPNVEWDEDTSLIDGLNLYDYFQDIDSQLIFEVQGNNQTQVSIESGLVTFSSTKDFNGVENITITAIEDFSSIHSNVITLTIAPTDEPPIFSPLNCQTEIEEDKPYSCTLEAVDLENDTLTFSSYNENSLNCQIQDDKLTYSSHKDYNGEASCDLLVADKDGSHSLTLNVNITPINDAPRITSKNPQDIIVSIIEGNTKEFTITGEDIDSPFSTSWFINSLIKNTNSNTYTFSESPGTYKLEAILSDNEFTSKQFWNVIVGPISDFTCSEVQGYILEKDKVCNGEILNVKDSDSCCSLPGAPSFQDAKACEEISSKLKIDIDTPNENSEIELSDTIQIKLDITNDFDEEQGLDIEAHLYDLKEDESIENVEDALKLDSKESQKITLELKIPENLDVDNEYALFVKAEDSICSQQYILLNELKRQKNLIEITEFNIENELLCGETYQVTIKLQNLGSEEQDVRLSLKNSDLDITEQSPLFTLGKYNDDNDKETKELSITIPKDTQGIYELEAIASYASRTSLKKNIEVSCIEEKVQEQTLQIEDKITLNPESSQTPIEKLQSNSQEKQMSILPIILLSFNLLLLTALIVSYFLFLRE